MVDPQLDVAKRRVATFAGKESCAHRPDARKDCRQGDLGRWKSSSAGA